MRIAVITNLFPPRVVGGAELSTRILASSLARRDHNVRLASLVDADAINLGAAGLTEARTLHPWRPYDAFDGERHGTLSKAVWHILESLGGGRALGPLHAWKNNPPDVVLTQNVTGLGTRLFAGLRRLVGPDVPIVHTVRDYGLLCAKNTMLHSRSAGCHSSALCICRQVSSRSATLAVDAVVGVSRHVVQTHLDRGLFARSSVHVVPNSIAPQAPAATRQREKRFTFGYVGRLSPEKGLRELISAYASVRERLPEIGNLAIAGTGRSEFVDELKAMAAGHPIHFVGRVEPYEFFADCSTAVVPSVWAEPFGRVVLEAATAGCRLLISNLGGLPEALTVAGEPAVGASSTLFDPRDPGDFEAALQRAAGLSEFSATNRRTPEDVARDYEQIVSDLLTVRGR